MARYLLVRDGDRLRPVTESVLKVRPKRKKRRATAPPNPHGAGASRPSREPAKRP